MTAGNVPALLLVLAMACTSCGGDETGKSRKAEPLSEAALIKLCKSDIEDEVIVAVVKKRGISFEGDEAGLARLKKGGVSEAVLASFRIAGPGEDGIEQPREEQEKSSA